MKIVIDNVKFDYNLGCRLLKLKYGNVPFGNLADIWESITPMTFKEISKEISNLEQRRVAINCLGLEKIYEEVNPELVSKKTVKKTTTWVNSKGELETIKFKDTYELYRVKGEVWGGDVTDKWARPQDVFFVKFKDTSTDRNYMIWVDAQSVYRTNNPNKWLSSQDDVGKITPIDAISWTIQTNIEKGGIEKILRQGDCILIKTKKNAKIGLVRHLTEKEYLELLVAES
jgi:hypothetical protein